MERENLEVQDSKSKMILEQNSSMGNVKLIYEQTSVLAVLTFLPRTSKAISYSVTFFILLNCTLQQIILFVTSQNTVHFTCSLIH
jgi:hypothetical protein